MENILTFDTSALAEKKYSGEEFKSDMKDKVEIILKREFPDNNRKQRVKSNYHTLQFACPFCRDSAYDSNKKRGNLLFDGKFAGYYKCFNCGKFMSFNSFFREFDTELDLGEVQYIADHKGDLTSKNSSVADNIDLFNSDLINQYAIDKEKFRQILSLELVDKEHKNQAYYYLMKRCQYNTRHFLYDPRGQYLIVMNLTNEDKILGLQIRDLTGQRKNKYLTFTLEKIYKTILKKNVEIPDEVNSLSNIFNIFNVDFYKPVLVTEGPLDSFLLPNCIATAGAHKNFNMNMNFYYVYDSDKTGNEEAMKKLSEGSYVFMWEELKKDYNLPDKKKWDINDVVIYLHDKGIKINSWSKYFSNDSLNILDI